MALTGILKIQWQALFICLSHIGQKSRGQVKTWEESCRLKSSRFIVILGQREPLQEAGTIRKFLLR